MGGCCGYVHPARTQLVLALPVGHAGVSVGGVPLVGVRVVGVLVGVAVVGTLVGILVVGVLVGVFVGEIVGGATTWSSKQLRYFSELDLSCEKCTR